MSRYRSPLSVRRAQPPAVFAATFALGLAIGIAVGAMAANHTSGTAIAATPEIRETKPVASVAPAVGRYAVDVIRVIDGDTFEARVRVWPGFDLSTKVRLRGIDAPEMKARCGEERSRAEAAFDALRVMLAERDVTIAGVTPDKYFGRIVADVTTRRTPDVSAALLERRLVRNYAGGRRDGWCDTRALDDGR